MIGAQLPDLLHQPPFFTNVGDDAIALAMTAGLVLDEWQQHVLRCSLGFRENGLFAAPEMTLIVPRQNGKNAVLEARELAGLFLLNEETMLHSAHQVKTAQEAYLRIKSLIVSDEDLEGEVLQFYNSAQEIAVHLKNGHRLKFVARATGRGSGRGFSGDFVVLDEAFDIPQEVLSDLLPTLSARKNPQVWYTSSTGKVDSDILRNQRNRGLAKDPLMGYFEWAADEGCDLSDKAQWYKSNPALGIRISEEDVEREFKSMDAERFARERLGLWASTDVDAAIREDIWRKNEDDTSLIDRERPIAIGIELHKVNGDEFKTSIYAAGMNQMDQLSVQMMQCADGTDWVAEWVRSKVDTYTITGVGIDTGSHAKALIPELTRLGVEVKGVGTSDIGAACSNFLNKLVSFQLRHRQDSYLSSAAIGAIKRFFRKDDPDSLWAWGKRDYMTDISPLVAATLAVHVFSMTPPPPKRSGRFW